ncbi:MAG: hypothetical protein QXP36_01950 [Conexivisphaerales archaeon]
MIKVLFSNVEWRKVEQGIAIRSINHPWSERIVEMSADVRDKVWEWLHNPRIVDREEWMKIREPVKVVLTEVAEVIQRYGSPLQREVFKRKIGELVR